jgi:hypothetical protein
MRSVDACRVIDRARSESNELEKLRLEEMFDIPETSGAQAIEEEGSVLPAR